MTTDFLTILGQVLAGVFGPWLVMLLIVAVWVVGFIAALFSGSQEADFPWQVTLAVWITYIVLALFGIALMIFVSQFEVFAWVPLKGN